MDTSCGFFVEVSDTFGGVSLSQVHPVLDNANRPLAKPNAFQINTSIMRCLVKASALHGLGLYIYAGEDLPTDFEGGEPKQPEQQAGHAPAASAGREEVNNRIRKALWGLGFTTKEAAFAKVKEMTTFTGQDKKTISGKEDYHSLSDSSASLLADKLDKMLTDRRADKQICASCGATITGERCEACDPF
jgi:hypothetical protein